MLLNEIYPEIGLLINMKDYTMTTLPYEGGGVVAIICGKNNWVGKYQWPPEDNLPVFFKKIQLSGNTEISTILLYSTKRYRVLYDKEAMSIEVNLDMIAEKFGTTPDLIKIINE